MTVTLYQLHVLRILRTWVRQGYGVEEHRWFGGPMDGGPRW